MKGLRDEDTDYSFTIAMCGCQKVFNFRDEAELMPLYLNAYHVKNDTKHMTFFQPIYLYADFIKHLAT